MQVKAEKLLVENSQLRAQLSEAKQKLESEVGWHMLTHLYKSSISTSKVCGCGSVGGVRVHN